MSHEEFDVAVIGDGPAGALAARLLAAAGARTALIGRQRWPGSVEMLSGRARRAIASLCPGISIAGIDIKETVSRWDGAERATASAILNPWGPGLAVERARLDALLCAEAAHAGTAVMKATVRKVSLDRVWTIAGTPVTAAQLIIATGRQGFALVERGAWCSEPRLMLYRRHAGSCDDRLVIEWERDGWWHALPDPRGGSVSGYCAQPASLRGGLEALWRAKSERVALLHSIGPPTSRIAGRMATVKTFPRVAGERWVAVGDAAFGCDPLSGEGLCFAALCASRAVAVVLNRDSPSAYGEWIAHCAADHHRQRAAFLQ